MNNISLSENYISAIPATQNYVLFPFYCDGKPIFSPAAAPLCGMTLLRSGSMRFRWNEENPNRKQFIQNFEEKYKKTFVPVQLDHTKIVYDVKTADETNGKIGDGIITKNPELAPTITVADCVPIFLYDKVQNVFGIVHSGWKGTGIIENAIKLSCEKYQSRVEDFLVVIGPHIHQCCYVVNEERAEYFAKNFSEDCIARLEEDSDLRLNWNNGSGNLYRLSLEKANTALLKRIGVQDKNITVYNDCTCCTKLGNEYIYGSNRRETIAAGRPDKFTVQAAFISY